MDETLKEVRRCTQAGVRINLFMMANDFGLEDFTVKAHSSRHILRPDEVFQFLDVHIAALYRAR